MKHPAMLRLAFALIMAPAILCGPSRTSAAEGTPSPKPTPLLDKTLVVWASPATLTQRGGSILTLNDPQDRFDGIVFGEIAPGKWMAGSELYRRTLRDQAGVPVETADAETFVQIAIAYRGNEVAVFRNGLPYSRYTTYFPQFGQ